MFDAKCGLNMKMPYHCSKSLSNHLGRTFESNWIWHGCSIAFPLSTLLVCFLWDAMKNFVYDTTVNSEMNLKARIHISAATIKAKTKIFANIRKTMSLRCHTCIPATGCSFEQLQLYFFYVQSVLHYFLQCRPIVSLCLFIM